MLNEFHLMIIAALTLRHFNFHNHIILIHICNAQGNVL